MEYRDVGLGKVLTEEEINQIRADIAATSAPSWVTSVPSNLGSPSHGKLKADQWRTLGITHLPLSLIRLWALESNTQQSKKRKEVLGVTISLISAVVLASSRTTSLAIATAYLHNMKAYMEGIKKLFPQYQFRPNHHMALHLHEYLCWFGPVHGWWTFPFERLIGMLERMPTNFKIGMSTVSALLNIHHLRYFYRSVGTNNLGELHSFCKSSSICMQVESMPLCHLKLPVNFQSTCRSPLSKHIGFGYDEFHIW